MGSSLQDDSRQDHRPQHDLTQHDSQQDSSSQDDSPQTESLRDDSGSVRSEHSAIWPLSEKSADFRISSTLSSPPAELPAEIPSDKLAQLSEDEQPESKSDLEAAEAPKPPPNPAAIDVKGWRRVALVIAALSGLFLGFLDTTIVSVALPTIADDFGEFGLSTWVVTAYLLTYMGKAPFVNELI